MKNISIQSALKAAGKFILPSLLPLAFLTSCQDDKKSPEPVNPNQTGTLTLKFENVVGAQALLLNTNDYTNAASETFKVTAFKYYVSNIKVERTDGSFYTVPQDSSYFLIDEAVPASKSVKLKVPYGSYKGFTFILGVDSLRNTMDLTRRTGALDPANGMYWAWNSGYKFLLLEGTSPAITSSGGVFKIHVGGFGGGFQVNNVVTRTANNNVSFNIPFGSDVAQVSANMRPEIHLMVDVLKVLGAPNPVSFATKATRMSISPDGVEVSQNYREGRFITYDHMH